MPRGHHSLNNGVDTKAEAALAAGSSGAKAAPRLSGRGNCRGEVAATPGPTCRPEGCLAISARELCEKTANRGKL
eukprot:SAG22_NODE_1664_length_3864_cov_1.637716_2_plen_75_part_00